jgi:hypothetical protein
MRCGHPCYLKFIDDLSMENWDNYTGEGDQEDIGGKKTDAYTIFTFINPTRSDLRSNPILYG